MIDKELLDMLVCVSCKNSLKYTIDEESLVCKKCGIRYPILENITSFEE
ncbi:MAG: Trm112 family protein [archaeon]